MEQANLESYFLGVANFYRDIVEISFAQNPTQIILKNLATEKMNENAMANFVELIFVCTFLLLLI